MISAQRVWFFWGFHFTSHSGAELLPQAVGCPFLPPYLLEALHPTGPGTVESQVSLDHSGLIFHRRYSWPRMTKVVAAEDMRIFQQAFIRNSGF